MPTTDLYERLGYRELGQRLGITTDAARMKAKREAKAKRWRLIPGNHPQDPVTVEIPVGIVPPLDPDAPAPTPAPPKGEGDWRRLAEGLTDRVAQLTDMLLAEQQANGTRLAELAAAETRELGTAQELATARAELCRAQEEIDELKRRLRRRGFIRTHRR